MRVRKTPENLKNFIGILSAVALSRSKTQCNDVLEEESCCCKSDLGSRWPSVVVAAAGCGFSTLLLLIILLLQMLQLQVNTHTRTRSLNHTLFLHQSAHTHSRALSLSLSPLSLSLRSLARSLTLSLSLTYTCKISLAHPLIHSNCTHSLSLQVVCLLSLLLAVFCAHSLHPRSSYICHFSLSTNVYAPGTRIPGRMGGLLFKQIYFHLIQIRICRACAPSSLSLVLGPLLGYFVSHSQPESHRE